MTRTLVPFTSRLPRLWGDFEREMEDRMRRMFDWDEDEGAKTFAFSPRLNVAETESGYEVTVDLPGMKPEEVNVEFRDDALWITGERKSETEEKEKAYHRVERHYGSFRRIIRLDTDVNPESIGANYKEGVLTITAAKTEANRPKKIEVHA
jgi:HSP20 family protein